MSLNRLVGDLIDGGLHNCTLLITPPPLLGRGTPIHLATNGKLVAFYGERVRGGYLATINTDFNAGLRQGFVV